MEGSELLLFWLTVGTELQVKGNLSFLPALAFQAAMRVWGPKSLEVWSSAGINKDCLILLCDKENSNDIVLTSLLLQILNFPFTEENGEHMEKKWYMVFVFMELTI